jgi:DNA-binding NtrC family response regulator
MNILVADDEESIRFLLAELLQSKEHNPILACNGEEALTCWQKSLNRSDYILDAVFTDIVMPKLDGLKLIKSIRADDKIVPIVAMTGYSNFSIAQEAIHIGASDFLLKPFRAGDFYLRLDRIMKLKALKMACMSKEDGQHALSSDMTNTSREDVLNEIAKLEDEIRQHQYAPYRIKNTNMMDTS